MPRVIITAAAVDGLARCRQFLAEKNQVALERAGLSIARQFLLLETAPEIGRPLDDVVELRELTIPFGDSGYVALYRYEPSKDEVYVLAFRHQKEAGYG
jgi:plasmid stabilization system protein ParE